MHRPTGVSRDGGGVRTRSLLRRNVAVNVTGGGITMLGQVVLFPLAVATAGLHDYGVWLTVLGLVTFLSQLDGGLGTALIQSTARNRAAGDSAVLHRLAAGAGVVYPGLSMALALVAIPVALTVIESLRDTTVAPTVVAAIACVALVLAVVTRRAQALTMGAQRFDVERLHQMVGMVVRAIVLLAAYTWDWGLLGVAVSEALYLAVPGLLSSARLSKVAPDVSGAPRFAAVAEVVRVLPFSLRAGGLAAMQTAAVQLPVTLVGVIGGPTVATLYAAPQRVQTALRQVMSWATYPLLPAWAAAVPTAASVAPAAGPSSPARPAGTLRAAFPFGFLTGVITAPLIFFSGDVLDVWVGSDFRPAQWLLSSVAVVVLVQGLHGLPLIMGLASGGGGRFLGPMASSTAAVLAAVSVTADVSLAAVAIALVIAAIATEPLFLRAVQAHGGGSGALARAYALGATGPLVATAFGWAVTRPLNPSVQLAAGITIGLLLQAAAAARFRVRLGFG